MLSANTALIQILEDNHSYTVVKCLFHTTTANDEVDALKINVATLIGQTRVLTLTANSSAWVPGEMITGNTTSATAFVKDWAPATNALTVVLGTGTLSNTEGITGDMLKRTAAINGTITIPQHLVDIRSILWNITAPAKIEVEWGLANGSFSPAITLAESGYFGENSLPSQIKNDATGPNGNIYVSTHGLTAKGGYSLILELSKQAGFAQRPIY